MNLKLLHTEVQEFLESHYQDDLTRLVLKGSPFEGVSPQELAVQIYGKKKAEKKLPSWFNTPGIMYPPSINLEQASSEKTASYKASLMEGKSVVDLTGGMGVDVYFFAQKFSKVVHCELNSQLQDLASHNLKQLGATHVEYYSGDGITFLQKTEETFDWIYVDPSRRDYAGGRVFQLSDCLPDVPGHLNLLLSKGQQVMIKTSPLLDLQAGILELQKVKEIHILAVENEVKEIIWILNDKTEESPIIKTINLAKKETQYFEDERNQRYFVAYGAPEKYIYEPNASIMKSGLFEALAHKFSLSKLHQNTHLFTSSELIDFPGRRFELKDIIPYTKKNIKKALPGKKAHVTTRNFPETVSQIRKKFKIQEGGNLYLFFTTLYAGEKSVLVCHKIK